MQKDIERGFWAPQTLVIWRITTFVC